MKKASLLLIAMLLLLVLTGCGSKDEAWAGGGEPMDNISYDPVTLSEYLEGGQRIWFRTGKFSNHDTVSGVAKDSEGYVLVTQPDGSLLTSNRIYKLGDVSQMSDEDIVAMLEQDENVQYTSYKLVISTDSTGNYTNTEEIYYATLLEYGESVFSVSLLYDCGLHEIYQSYYDGFVLEGGEKYLLTRVDSDVMFELDPVGTEGIPLDVKYNTSNIWD